MLLDSLQDCLSRSFEKKKIIIQDGNEVGVGNSKKAGVGVGVGVGSKVNRLNSADLIHCNELADLEFK